MAMPKVLDWLDDLVAKVATNTTNIAKNAQDIKDNRKLFDDHAADDVRHWTTADRQNFDRVVHFKGYFTTIQALKTAYPTGQLGDYAIVGETDTVWVWDDTKNEWLNSTEQGIVISVNGRTGEVILTKTDVGLSNVDNTADVNKPISTAQQAALDDKTDRKGITAADADSLTLRAGIYDLKNVSRTILGFTSNYWTIIVGEDSGSAHKSVSQIWTNYDSAGESHVYVRHQVTGSSWSDFKELATNTDISGLQTQITTNKNNIKTNADDIDKLEISKADRKILTDAEVDSLTVRAGIYNYLPSSGSKTILGYSDRAWTIIVGEWGFNNDGTLSSSTDVKGARTQIWIPYQDSKMNQPKMFFRRASSTTWGNFAEILTSKHFTDIEISRVKQYKGYFPTLQDLKTTYPTATDGDYAIVKNALYIWNAPASSWTEVSGSGGSGGTGKWSIKNYKTNNPDKFNSMTKIVPELKYLTQCELYRQIEVDDTVDEILTDWGDDAQFYLIETYVKVQEATSLMLNFSQMEFKTGINIYINGDSIFSTADSSTDYTGDPYPNVTLEWGWNKIQVLIYDMRENAVFKLGRRITDEGTCETIDCYHNFETVVEDAYVPLFGDSTIEGNIQVQGTVGITNKSYLKYNEDDNSLSFMFGDNMNS